MFKIDDVTGRRGSRRMLCTCNHGDRRLGSAASARLGRSCRAEVERRWTLTPSTGCSLPRRSLPSLRSWPPSPPPVALTSLHYLLELYDTTRYDKYRRTFTTPLSYSWIIVVRGDTRKMGEKTWKRQWHKRGQKSNRRCSNVFRVLFYLLLSPFLPRLFPFPLYSL